MNCNTSRFTAVLVCMCSIAITDDMASAEVVVRDTITISPIQSFTPDPSIDGDLVVWLDGRNGSRDVYGYNLATGQEFSIATGGREKYYPQVDGQYVLWSERSSGTSRHIFAKDLVTDTVHTVLFGAISSDEYYHVVNGKVYYSADLPGSPSVQHIYSYDLLSGQTEQISTTTFNSHGTVRGADGLVTWKVGDSVSVYDTTSGQTVLYTTDGQNISEPDVSGDLLVSVVRRLNRGTIEVIDLNDGSNRVIDTTGKLTHPSIDGHLLAYIDFDTLPGTLRAIDLANDTLPTILVSDPIVLQTQQNLEVSGNRIVWTEVVNPWDQFQVKVTTVVPEPAAFMLLTVGSIGLLRRRNI